MQAARGAVTIRAYGDTGRYNERLFRHLDRNLAASSHAKLLMRWSVEVDARRLYLRLALRCLAIGSLAPFFAAIAVIRQGLDSAEAGFVLSFAAVFAWRVQWSVRFYTSFELVKGSVERIGEYIDLEQEPSSDKRPPAAWPSRGCSVDVSHFSLRYAPGLPLALDDVSFRVEPGTRCGIVGRSGSGKSSTALALLSMVRAESGTITIDGLDISSLRVEDLRDRITFIAQGAHRDATVLTRQTRRCSAPASGSISIRSASTTTPSSTPCCGSSASLAARPRRRPSRAAATARKIWSHRSRRLLRRSSACRSA